MTTISIGWIRGFAVFLALPNLVTGVWAVLSPRGFYDDFPGIGPALVSAEPPYNPHLITDAGSGFLATGVALLIAAAVGSPPALRLGFLVLIAFALPHGIYHAANPAPSLSDASNALNVVLLGAEVVLPLLLLLLIRDPKETDVHPPSHLGPSEGAAQGTPQPR